MSKLAEQFRTIGIYNNHNLLNKFGTRSDVVVEYHAPAPGRMGWCDCKKSLVWSPLFPVDPTANSRKNGLYAKNFYQKRAISFPLALEFAEKTYGQKMTNSPFGGKVSEDLMKRAMEFLKKNKT